MLWISILANAAGFMSVERETNIVLFPCSVKQKDRIKIYQTFPPLTPDAPLFCNKNGERLTRQGIRYIIQKYSKIANKNEPGIIESSAYPHILRHSKATHLVNRGVNIYNVRDFLGHESVATTQVYLTTNPEITRKAIESVAEKTVPESLDFFSEEERG